MPPSPAPPPPQADAAEGLRDCIAWLLECGATVADAEGPDPAAAALDCKASGAGGLRMPEEKERVAHGDENLRIDDFLKSFG